MSIWRKVEDEMPPLNEEVLILYKSIDDELCEENLSYGIAQRCIRNPLNIENGGYEDWSGYVDYQGYYEVVFWCPLIDMPSKLIGEKGEENG